MNCPILKHVTGLTKFWALRYLARLPTRAAESGSLALCAVHFLSLPSDPAVASNALAIWIVFPLAGATPVSFNKPELPASLGKLKNKINNILSAHGIELKREELSSEKGLQKVLSFPWDTLVAAELQVLVDQIRSLNESIKKLESTIHEEGPKQEGHTNLTSIKGIGKTSASILLSVIGDVNDFENEGKIASYLGLVPRVSNSNETERSGRITKQGNKLARTTLVQCALIAIRYSPYLRTFYERKKVERGTGKAIIALARKFLRVIYNTLKNKWVFEDFPNFVLQDANRAGGS